MKKLIIGIDPGKKGGVAVLTVTSAAITPTVSPMPQIYKTLFNMLKDIGDLHYDSIHAYLEDVQYRSNQRGVKTALTNWGRIQGYLEALGIPYTVVSAMKWKKHMGLSQDKIESINLANQIYGLEFTKTQDGLAEALLIAHHGVVQNVSKTTNRDR